MNPLLRNMLPQSFGDCASATHVAPPPCAGSMPLAYVRTNVYEATARWATGLNSTELHAARFDASKSRWARGQYELSFRHGLYPGLLE